jgi:hypothetical protein
LGNFFLTTIQSEISKLEFLEKEINRSVGIYKKQKAYLDYVWNNSRGPTDKLEFEVPYSGEFRVANNNSKYVLKRRLFVKRRKLKGSLYNYIFKTLPQNYKISLANIYERGNEKTIKSWKKNSDV